MYSIYWLIVLAVLILINYYIGFDYHMVRREPIAFIVSLFVDNIILEIILFLLVSFALLYFTRPLVIKHFNPKRTKTNYQGVIGKEAMVTITIDNMNATGQVIVDGQEWSARSLDGNVIEKGTKVKVEGISGVKLIVSII